MPTVRVILITFHRPLLLPRALESLLRQTFTDWVCEVHNGDPADPHPGELLISLNDPRLHLVIPKQKTGPVEAFNLAHRTAPECYQSLLEDDNWWEPTFLEKMVSILDQRPEIELAWTNLRIWEEAQGNRWYNTGRCLWNVPPDSQPRLFQWPNLIQFSDMIYSNGSMVLRSRKAESLQMPPYIPRDMIEHVRERMMTFPILLVPEPLVNFAITIGTMRSTDHSGWGESQALLGAAFLQNVPMTERAVCALWAYRRSLRPRSTSGLIFAGLLQRRWAFLRQASAGDWCGFLRGAIRRPFTALRIVRSKRNRPDTWGFLNEQAATRTVEARSRGFVVLDAPSLIDKSSPGAFGLEHCSPY